MPAGLTACGKCHKFYLVTIKEIESPIAKKESHK
jgi:hypothetical protein